MQERFQRALVRNLHSKPPEPCNAVRANSLASRTNDGANVYFEFTAC
jgi:hypothetical protein